jgi:hypothetical protein
MECERNADGAADFVGDFAEGGGRSWRFGGGPGLRGGRGGNLGVSEGAGGSGAEQSERAGAIFEYRDGWLHDVSLTTTARNIRWQ